MDWGSRQPDVRNVNARFQAVILALKDPITLWATFVAGSVKFGIEDDFSLETVDSFLEITKASIQPLTPDFAR